MGREHRQCVGRFVDEDVFPGRAGVMQAPVDPGLEAGQVLSLAP